MSQYSTIKAHMHVGGGSHLPILIKVLSLSDGPVLELGTGLFSTPYLHWACYDAKRKLVSYENKKEFFDTWNYEDKRESNNDYSYHQRILVENNEWDKIDISEHWGVVFIDHNPGPRRREEMKRVANNADYVVVHDTDDKNDFYYKYAEYFPLFKYRWDSKIYPRTTVLSNFKDLSNL